MSIPSYHDPSKSRTLETSGWKIKLFKVLNVVYPESIRIGISFVNRLSVDPSVVEQMDRSVEIGDRVDFHFTQLPPLTLSLFSKICLALSIGYVGRGLRALGRSCWLQARGLFTRFTGLVWVSSE